MFRRKSSKSRVEELKGALRAVKSRLTKPEEFKGLFQGSQYVESEGGFISHKDIHGRDRWEKKKGRWISWKGFEQKADQGYKVRVSATLKDARAVAEVVKEFCEKEKRIHYKLSNGLDSLQQINRDGDGEKDLQYKFITLYLPDNPEFAAKAIKLLDEKLAQAGLSTKTNRPRGDTLIGDSGRLSYRFGDFSPARRIHFRYGSIEEDCPDLLNLDLSPHKLEETLLDFYSRTLGDDRRKNAIQYAHAAAKFLISRANAVSVAYRKLK